jgi:drug/metabolite transporter (DMT)-like permease
LIDGDVSFLLSKAQLNSDSTSDGVNERLALIFAAMFVLGLMTERFRTGQGSTTLLVSLSLCGFSSVAMHVINKVSISVLPLPFTLVAVQMIITVVTLLACCDAKCLLHEIYSDPRSLKWWSSLTLPYVGVLVSMMFALSEGTVTTILLVRNTLPLLSTFVERFFFPDDRDMLTVQSCMALYCVALGTLVCMIYDLKDIGSLTTIGWIALNMVLTLVHRLSQRWLLLDPRMGLSCAAMTLVTNATGLFLVLPLCFLYDESRMWFSARVWSTLLGDPSAPGCILLSGVVAASLGYYSVAAQRHVSATCLLVVQTASKMITMTASMLIFSVSWYWSSALGCSICLGGCVWYMVTTLRSAAGLDELGPSKGDYKQVLDEAS